MVCAHKVNMVLQRKEYPKYTSIYDMLLKIISFNPLGCKSKHFLHLQYKAIHYTRHIYLFHHYKMMKSFTNLVCAVISNITAYNDHIIKLIDLVNVT